MDAGLERRIWRCSKLNDFAFPLFYFAKAKQQ